jgi:OmpA-OmpF porin, OOP family
MRGILDEMRGFPDGGARAVAQESAFLCREAEMIKCFTRALIAGSAIAYFSQSSSARAAPVEVEGVIVTNQDGRLTIKTPHGDQVIALSERTRVRSVSGVFGGQKETVTTSALLPGLPVVITGDDATGHAVATDIQYKESDYKTAVQISAGVQETSRREAELRSAYSKMGEWQIHAERNVYFKTGSATISQADKQVLMELANQAQSHKGYVISVLGHADPSGNAAANERLSERRAQTVTNYLKQSGHVLPGRILAPSAMGEIKLPPDTSDSGSYANARRVTVRILSSAAHLGR